VNFPRKSGIHSVNANSKESSSSSSHVLFSELHSHSKSLQFPAIRRITSQNPSTHTNWSTGVESRSGVNVWSEMTNSGFSEFKPPHLIGKAVSTQFYSTKSRVWTRSEIALQVEFSGTRSSTNQEEENSDRVCPLPRRKTLIEQLLHCFVRFIRKSD
jgi:hypothetical protein